MNIGIWYHIFKRKDGKYDVYKCFGDTSSTLFKVGISERAVKKYIETDGSVFVNN